MSWFPDLRPLVRFGASVVDELSALPESLVHGRDAVTRLPGQIAALVTALERTTAALDRALPELTRAIASMEDRIDHVDRIASEVAAELTRTAASLERILPEVSNAVGAMDSRVRNLDTTISDLGGMVFTLIDSIPGARRVLRRPARSAE